MNFNGKMVIFLIIMGVIVWINIRYKNIVIRCYNYLSTLPKIFLIVVGGIAIVSPFLLQGNPIVDTFKDFLPDSVSRNIDMINTVRNIQNQQMMPNQRMIPNQRMMPNQRILANQQIYKPKVKRNVSEQVKKKVAARQEWKCFRCGNLLDETYEVDHTLALIDKGDNDLNNLRALCPNCHRKKTVDDDLKRKYPNGKIF